MELLEAIAQRYSYREPFAAQRVPREDLQRIVQAGLQAPSGCNQQTTRFVIIDDPALTAQVAQIVGTNPAMKTAPAYLVCLVSTQPEPVFEDLSFEVEDCAAAVENMLLAITALGYASVWVDGALRRDQRAERLGQLLGVPETKVIRVILPVGVPSVQGPRRDKLPFDERAWFNRYDGD